MILWNLTKFQLNQTTYTKYGNENCLKEQNDLKLCEVSQNSFSHKYKKYNSGLSFCIGQESSNMLSQFSGKGLILGPFGCQVDATGW